MYIARIVYILTVCSNITGEPESRALFRDL